MSLKDQFNENTTPGEADQTNVTDAKHSENTEKQNHREKVSSAALIIGIILLVLQALSIKGGVEIAHARGMSYSPFSALASFSTLGIAEFLGENFFGIIGIILIIRWWIRKARENKVTVQVLDLHVDIKKKRRVYSEKCRVGEDIPEVEYSKWFDNVTKRIYVIVTDDHESRDAEEQELIYDPDEEKTLEPSHSGWHCVSKEEWYEAEKAFVLPERAAVHAHENVIICKKDPPVESTKDKSTRQHDQQIEQNRAKKHRHGTDRSRWKAAAIAASALCIVLLIAAGVVIITMSMKVDSLEQDVEISKSEAAMQSEIASSIAEESSDLKWKVEIYESCIVVRPNDGEYKFHKLGCEKLSLDRGYWVYRIEEAFAMDLHPCVDCLQTGYYIGDYDTHVYHLPTCEKLPKAWKRIYMFSKNEASEYLLMPCSFCCP